jgi:hypothetical protein
MESLEAASGVELCFGSDDIAFGVDAMADSSTMTEGSRPLVYDAVNSHGSPDLRQRVHGHRPEHLVFFLCNVSSCQNVNFLSRGGEGLEVLANVTPCNTHFLHRSHALLTLDLSFSSRRLFAGGSLEPASGGEVAAPLSVWAVVPFAGVHPVDAVASLSDRP